MTCAIDLDMTQNQSHLSRSDRELFAERIAALSFGSTKWRWGILVVSFLSAAAVSRFGNPDVRCQHQTCNRGNEA